MDGIRYTNCGGNPTSDQRLYAQQSPLYRHGDMVLVWVNEGDLYIYGKCMDDAVSLHSIDPSYNVEIPIEGFPDLAPPAQSYSGGPVEQNDNPGPMMFSWLGHLLITVMFLLLGSMLIWSLVQVFS